MSPRACSRSPECSVGLFQHLPGSERLTGDQRVRQEVARETPRPKRKGLGEAKARTLTAEESGVRDQGLRGAPRGQGRVLGRDELRGWQASREHPGCEAGQGADSRSPTSRIRTSFFMLEARRGRTRPARMERTPHAGSAQPVAPLSPRYCRLLPASQASAPDPRPPGLATPPPRLPLRFGAGTNQLRLLRLRGRGRRRGRRRAARDMRFRNANALMAGISALAGRQTVAQNPDCDGHCQRCRWQIP